MVDMCLWQHVMKVNPFATKDDVIELKEIDDYDIFIVFRNGTRVIIDRYTGYHKNINHNKINELSKDQDKIEFAYRLRRLMKYKHINQERLAKEIGTSQVMISRYVRGETTPNAIILRQIAKVLNCSMDDFFDKEY